MRASRILGVLAGATAIALAVLTVSAPASAATIAAGQKITIIDALDQSEGEGPFYNVNPADAAATPVGTPTGAYTYGLEVNDDGVGWAIGLSQFGDSPFLPTIWDANANNGTVSNPRALLFAEGDYPDRCEGIDLNPTTGELLIACVQYDVPELGDISTINTVDLATGLLTAVVLLNGEAFQEFTAIATNPVTHVLWGFGPYDGDASFIIDRTLQSATLEAYMDNNVWAADFDRNGQLFLSSELYDGAEFEWPSLAVTDPSDGNYSFNEWFVATDTDAVLIFVGALSVWGKLAATGSTPAETLPVALGSALLLLAGAAFIATARLTRRAG